MAPLTAGFCNWLGHYASSTSYRAYCEAELADFSLVMSKTIAITHCAHLWGKARLSCLDGLF